MSPKPFLAYLVTMSVVMVIVGGCGSGGTPSQTGFAGKWRGVVSGGLLGSDLVVNAELTPAGAGDLILMGSMSTNAPTCFNNAPATAVVSKTSLTSLSGTGSGTSTQSALVTISGELTGDKITGLFRMISVDDVCNIPMTGITLDRQ